jgi:hypothetical protein
MPTQRTLEVWPSSCERAGGREGERERGREREREKRGERQFLRRAMDTFERERERERERAGARARTHEAVHKVSKVSGFVHILYKGLVILSYNIKTLEKF